MAHVQANSSGVLTGTFQIPAGVPAGTKHVAFEGSGGSKANALYTAQGWRRTVTHEVNTVTTITYYESASSGADNAGGGGEGGADPVAQTFRLDETRQITGVALKFTHVGDATKPTRVQIREVELGVPTEVVLAEAIIPMAGVTVVDPASLSRSDSDWTVARFPHLLTLEGGRSYAVTVVTADGTHEVAIADLGGFDQVLGWVTANAFPNGTFIDGSDGRTWLAKPGRSLCFRLLGASYAQLSKTIELGTVAVAAATDLLPLLIAERPAGTSIEVEFETAAGAKYITGPNVNIELPASVTGNVAVRLRLKGTATLSPLLRPWLQAVIGALQSSGDYASRAFACGTDTRLRAIVDVYTPSTSTLTVSAQTGVSSGNPVWTPMTLEASTPLGDGWEERQYVLDSVSIAESRIRLVLAGGPAARPQVRNLRGIAVPMT